MINLNFSKIVYIINYILQQAYYVWVYIILLLTFYSSNHALKNVRYHSQYFYQLISILTQYFQSYKVSNIILFIIFFNKAYSYFYIGTNLHISIFSSQSISNITGLIFFFSTNIIDILRIRNHISFNSSRSR